MFCIPPNDSVEMNTQIIWDFLSSTDIEIRTYSTDEEQFLFKSSFGNLLLKEN